MFFRFKQNKNIVNVTLVNRRFKLRKTFIKPVFFEKWQKKVLASVVYKGEPIATPSISL